MFIVTEDIVWFKPVELRTKCGRRGHIKEPLGKAVAFDYRDILIYYTFPFISQVPMDI